MQQQWIDRMLITSSFQILSRFARLPPCTPICRSRFSSTEDWNWSKSHNNDTECCTSSIIMIHNFTEKCLIKRFTASIFLLLWKIVTIIYPSSSTFVAQNYLEINRLFDEMPLWQNPLALIASALAKKAYNLHSENILSPCASLINHTMCWFRGGGCAGVE